MAATETHPTDTAAVIRLAPDGPELVQMRWGWKPENAGEPVINVRAETADVGDHRCLVPADELELFTGAEHPKRRWRVTLKGEPVLFFAGLWRPPTPQWPESYAILTIDAAPDIATLNDRQPAVIRPADVAAWLSGADAARDLLRPLPAGTYDVRGED
jgi:putative SOS response-associated peptidase YedK